MIVRFLPSQEWSVGGRGNCGRIRQIVGHDTVRFLPSQEWSSGGMPNYCRRRQKTIQNTPAHSRPPPNCPQLPYNPIMRLILILFAFPVAVADTVVVLRHADLQEWEYRRFDDIAETSYSVEYDDSLGRKVLVADSQAGASGYIHKKDFDLQQTPWLHFQWRIDQAAGGFDERTKSGDDFAFRIYFVARDGLRYKTLSLARTQGVVGDSWTSPYASVFNDVRIYALIGGEIQTEQWHNGRVNVGEVWTKLFMKPPPIVGLIGIMTDADSTATQMRARYGDIMLSNSPQSPFTSPPLP